MGSSTEDVFDSAPTEAPAPSQPVYVATATVAHTDDVFDVPDDFDVEAGEDPKAVRKADPARPEAKRGRYTLPNPDTGKSMSWQRVTNFIKMTEDTYHLDRWKERNIIKGFSILANEGRVRTVEVAKHDVKVDKQRLNAMAEAAQDAADAYRMADEGTALHTSTELADYAGGDLNRVPVHHRTKVRMYLDALAVKGITVVPDLIERVTASRKYQCAGKFDRIFQLADGSLVIGDLKTGDSLDLSFPSIAAQLDCYQDGVNDVGIFDGRGWDRSVQVREDIGIVVHLPSTRDEVMVYLVDLSQGRRINEGNLYVRNVRRIKAKDVAAPYETEAVTQDQIDAHWIEQLNAQWDRDGLIAVAVRARSFGQWNERLAKVARNLSVALSS